MQWEDVWLLPLDGSSDSASYWFTLHALPSPAAGIEGEYPEDPDDSFCGFGGSALVREMNLRLLGDRDYFVTRTLDMVARVDDFNFHELLEWTTLFIRVHFADPEPELVEGAYDEFAGSNSQAREIDRIREAMAAGVPVEEIIDYRPEDSAGQTNPRRDR